MTTCPTCGCKADSREEAIAQEKHQAEVYRAEMVKSQEECEQLRRTIIEQAAVRSAANHEIERLSREVAKYKSLTAGFIESLPPGVVT